MISNNSEATHHLTREMNEFSSVLATVRLIPPSYRVHIEDLPKEDHLLEKYIDDRVILRLVTATLSE